MQSQHSAIQAVAFDVFGTLIHYPLKRLPYKRLAAYAPDSTTFKRLCLTHSIALADLAQEWQASAILPTLLADLAAEKQAMALYPEVPVVLAQLKQQGIKIAVCSNLAYEYGEIVRHLLPDIDVCVLSYEVGYAKPDAAIFQQVEQQLKVDKAHIVFIGDSQSCDYKGALAYGFQAAWLQRRAQQTLLDILADYKILQ